MVDLRSLGGDCLAPRRRSAPGADVAADDELRPGALGDLQRLATAAGAGVQDTVRRLDGQQSDHQLARFPPHGEGALTQQG